MIWRNKARSLDAKGCVVGMAAVCGALDDGGRRIKFGGDKDLASQLAKEAPQKL